MISLSTHFSVAHYGIASFACTMRSTYAKSLYTNVCCVNFMRLKLNVEIWFDKIRSQRENCSDWIRSTCIRIVYKAHIIDRTLKRCSNELNTRIDTENSLNSSDCVQNISAVKFLSVVLFHIDVHVLNRLPDCFMHLCKVKRKLNLCRIWKFMIKHKCIHSFSHVRTEKWSDKEKQWKFQSSNYINQLNSYFYECAHWQRIRHNHANQMCNVWIKKKQRERQETFHLCTNKFRLLCLFIQIFRVCTQFNIPRNILAIYLDWPVPFQ